MGVVEAEVVRWLEREAAGVESAAAAARVAASARVSADGELRRLNREVERIGRALKKLAMQNAEELISDDELRDARADYVGQRASLLEKVEQLGLQSRQMVVDRSAAAAELLDDWEVLQVETRREMLGRLIDRVVVVTGSRGGVPGVQGGGSSAVVEVFGA